MYFLIIILKYNELPFEASNKNKWKLANHYEKPAKNTNRIFVPTPVIDTRINHLECRHRRGIDLQNTIMSNNELHW